MTSTRTCQRIRDLFAAFARRCRHESSSCSRRTGLALSPGARPPRRIASRPDALFAFLLDVQKSSHVSALA